MNSDQYEQLGTGTAVINDDDNNFPTVKINPIAEGEITLGQSGEPTVWSREALEGAVEQNSLVDRDRGVSELVEGTGGRNPHHPLDEQVPPRSKLAQIDGWEYEAGVGPVAEVKLADEEIANRVELGLLDVSADLERELGDYNDQLGAREVEEILSMPRVTVVDRGASPNASIEPATAEALGYNPDAESTDDGTVGADTPVDNTDSTMPENDDVREQLSAAQSRVSELEDTKEQLAEDKEDLETEKETLEEQLSEKEETVDDLETEVEQLSPLKNVLAEAAAGDSHLDAEQLGERFTTSELIESLEDEESDKSAVETVQEQLAADPAPRGDASDDTPEDTEPSEEAEQLAQSAMNITDLQTAESEGLSSVEYLAREYDVDATEYGSADELRAAKAGDN